MRRHMVLVAVISMVVMCSVVRGDWLLTGHWDGERWETDNTGVAVSGRQCDARDAGHVMTPLHRDKWRHTLSPVDTRQHINNVASGGEGEGHTINIDMIKLIYFFNTLHLTLLLLNAMQRRPHHKVRSTIKWSQRAETSQVEHKCVH